MHTNFADWYQPVSFGHDRESMELRWKGIEASSEAFEADEISELIRLVFDRANLSSEIILGFKEKFRAEDATFKLSGNDLEVKVLAACTLAVICSKDTYFSNFAAYGILTASINGLRKIDCSVDLIGIAEETIKRIGFQDRKRPTLSFKIISQKKKLDEAAALLEATHDFPTVNTIFKKFSQLIESLSDGIQESTKSHLSEIENYLSIQDEEIETLWWLLSGWSDNWEIPFTKLDENVKPLLLSQELYSKSSILSEPPSINAIFSRAGLSETKQIILVESINNLEETQLRDLKKEKSICPTLQPLHFALDRAIEIAPDKTWVVSWSKVSGIISEAKITPIALALQFYREALILDY